MKNILSFCLAIIFTACFSASAIVYADTLEVSFITKNVSIVSPDGVTETYTDKNEIPEILYSSKILTFGMCVLSYHGLEIVLKNNQGIWFNKNPITKEIIISKVEDSRAGQIALQFDHSTSAQMHPDTKIALTYDQKEASITMKVLSGSVAMQQSGTEFELGSNESFRYTTKRNKRRNND